MFVGEIIIGLAIFLILAEIGKGSGAALAMFILGIVGVIVCLVFKNKVVVDD